MGRLSHVVSPVALALLLVTGCGSSDGSKTTPDSAACTAKTCASAGKNCGAMPNGCGQSVECGSCTAPQVCGGGGVANVCGSGTCTPTSCSARGKNCGMISNECDAVLACGGCTAPQVCGGGAGGANVCGTPVAVDLGTAKGDTGSSSGKCAASCMEQAGAECCTRCGCTAAVKCTPVCAKGWDCEMGKCF